MSWDTGGGRIAYLHMPVCALECVRCALQSTCITACAIDLDPAMSLMLHRHGHARQNSTAGAFCRHMLTHVHGAASLPPDDGASRTCSRVNVEVAAAPALRPEL